MEHLLFGENGWGAELLSGFGVTLTLAVSSYVGAFLLGLLLAFLASSSKRAVIVVWKVYASIMMGVPSLLVVFFIFYNMPILIEVATGYAVDVSQLTAGILALSLVYGAYLGEVVRGAISNIPRGQFDAGKALGLKTLPAFGKVILPQVWRLALPGLSNIWLVVLKDTVLVSLVGLTDVVRVANIAAGNTGKPFLFYITVGLGFVLLAIISDRITRRIEARLNIPYAASRT